MSLLSASDQIARVAKHLGISIERLGEAIDELAERTTLSMPDWHALDRAKQAAAEVR